MRRVSWRRSRRDVRRSRRSRSSLTSRGRVKLPMRPGSRNCTMRLTRPALLQIPSRPRLRFPDSLFRHPAMTNLRLRLIGPILLVAALLAGCLPASAHPHVWVKSSSELLYAQDGTLTGVRHVWTFDRTFSAYAVEGIESKTKGV